MSKEETFTIKGTVKECLPSTFFKVELENGLSVIATINGKMKKNRIMVLLGDSVEVEISPYDLTKGRITYRYKWFDLQIH